MDETLTDTMPRLPLADDALPESIRRFAASGAPGPAKLMAARGLVPVKGDDLVALLLQLSSSDDDAVRTAAQKTVVGLPDTVVLAASANLAHPAFLDELSRVFRNRDDALERILMNHATHDLTVASIARSCSEPLTEVIATNQARLLGAPVIIENLYKNRHTRMSTADRLIELAARNDVDLPGIPAFKYHVEAIAGQLIPEPSDEPLPGDRMFADALNDDGADPTAVDIDAVDGTETVKERWMPLSFRIREMTTSEKIRFAVVGDAAARALLIRDPKKVVYMAAITSPAMTDAEASNIAHSKEVSVDVLRFVGNRKEWLKNYDMKRALCFNPKTPLDVSIRFLAHLHATDLKGLANSRGISAQLKTMAKNKLEAKDKNRSK